LSDAPLFSSRPQAPEVFASIGLTGTSVGLLSSGIYGIVKIVATAAFIFLGIERIGRKWALGFGALGMSLFLWIIAAIFITHPVNKNLPEGATPPPSSMAMAAMIYLFVIPYCFSWGPVPWVYWCVVALHVGAAAICDLAKAKTS
jgi:hypothetical protein